MLANTFTTVCQEISKMEAAKNTKSATSTKSKISNNSSKIFETLNGTHSKLHPESQLQLAKIDSDLFKQFKGFLILGRCLGLIPITGVFKKSYKDLSCRFFSFAGLTSLFCIIILTLNMLLSIDDALRKHKRNASEIAESMRSPIFASWGLFVYSYFLYRRDLFIKIFKVWNNCSLSLTYTRKDKTLHLTIVLISIIMFTSTVLENAVLHMEFFVIFDDINGHTIKYGEEKAKDASVLQMYYWRAHPYWNMVLGSHPILAVLAFLNHKFVLYGGNYVDVLMSLFARALYFKFYALYKTAEEALLNPILTLENLDTYFSTELDRERQSWNQLAKDHDSLCEVLNAMNGFFSPVIFVSYTINIYYFCMQLLSTLNPAFTSHSIVHSIYSPWSFIHIIARIFILSLFMARVNEYAHKTREIVMRCPVELYGGAMAKLDKKVNVGPKLGFTGVGCFTVTKPFMLSILNVVFTIEIVLLQGLNAGDQQNGNCPTTG